MEKAQKIERVTKKNNINGATNTMTRVVKNDMINRRYIISFSQNTLLVLRNIYTNVISHL